MSEHPTNWAGNVTFQADRVHRPESVEQLQQIVRTSGRVRALGTGHSFSPVADTTGDLVSVAGLPVRFEVAPDRSAVTVSAGLRYGEVATRLHHAGLALAQPRLPAAHLGRRSGRDRHPRLGRPPRQPGDGSDRAGDGDRRRRAGPAVPRAGRRPVRRLRGRPRLPGRRHRADPARRADVRRGPAGLRGPAARPAAHRLRRGLRGGLQRERLHHLGRRRRRPGLGEAPDRRPASGSRRTVAGRPGRHRPTAPGAGDVAGELHRAARRAGAVARAAAALPAGPHAEQRRPSCRPSTCVPREHAVDALDAVAAIRDAVAPVLQVGELRTVAADDLWLSPAYGRDVGGAALHLGRRHRGRPAGGGRRRGAAARAARAAALGQGLRHRPRR